MKITISFEFSALKPSIKPCNKIHAFDHAFKESMFNERLDTISLNFIRQSRVLGKILNRLDHLDKRVQNKSD